MTILMVLFILMFVVCAFQVTRFAYTRKMPDMYWLAANFAAAAVGNMFTMVFYVPAVSMIFSIISSICTVVFVHRVFYRDRKSPYLYIIGLLLVLGVVQMYSVITNPANSSAMTQLGFAVVWGWQAALSFIAYRDLRNDRTVEDWVKGRYLMWFGYTAMMFVLSTRMLLPLPYAAFEYYITTPLVILAGIVQYITWAMPESVRNYLNRNYKPVPTANPAELMAMAEAEMASQGK